MISCLVFAPTLADLFPQDRERLLTRLSTRITHRKTIPLRFESCHFRFQLIDLSSRACLFAIKAAGVEKQGRRQLMPIQIHNTGGQ